MVQISYEEYIERLVVEVEIRGLTSKTVSSYKRSVGDFFYHYNKAPEELGVDEIKNYQRYLLKEVKYAANTVNGRISAIKFFYIYVLKRSDYIDLLPRVKVPQIMPIILTENEVARMITSVKSLLWKAVISTTYSAGLRNAEVRALKVSDIDTDRMVINIRDSKCQRSRSSLLSPVTLDILRQYWKASRTNNRVKSDYLFIPNRNIYLGEMKKKLSHSAIGYMVGNAARIAGIKKKFTHIFYATLLQPIF